MIINDNTIYIKNYSLLEQESGIPSVNIKEVWRYSGYAGGPDGGDITLTGLLNEIIEETLPILTYRLCYRKLEIRWKGKTALLPFMATSENLSKCLKGSNKGIMFAATIGIEIDRRIERYKRISPTKALLLQALGAERVEALCDTFCKEMDQIAQGEKLEITSRFSPGYGDFPLEVQRDFFDLLDFSRKIGITLNASLLMTPSKSVTAIFGIRPPKSTPILSDESKGKKCSDCQQFDCVFRKEIKEQD